MNENKFLRRIAELSDNDIKFKDESILWGTCWIGGMPVDLTLNDCYVTLNTVGAFEGDWDKLSKSYWRGKGKFRSLLPAIKQTLSEFGYEHRLYLTPISPVWKEKYQLDYDDIGYHIKL
jgi:hypothetical protein